MRKKLLIGILVLLIISSVIWFPITTFALTNSFNKLDYYIKALEYGLKGLQEYLKFVLELFKEAVT